MNSHLLLISTVLRAAGFRRGNQKRRSSRSRRWSRSAQTLFASWAVVGQLSGMGLLIGELVSAAPSGQASQGSFPEDFGGAPCGVRPGGSSPNAFNSRGSIAIGYQASAGYLTGNPSSQGTNNGSSIAIGTLANAAQYGSIAIGIGKCANCN